MLVIRFTTRVFGRLLLVVVGRAVYVSVWALNLESRSCTVVFPEYTQKLFFRSKLINTRRTIMYKSTCDLSASRVGVLNERYLTLRLTWTSFLRLNMKRPHNGSGHDRRYGGAVPTQIRVFGVVRPFIHIRSSVRFRMHTQYDVKVDDYDEN